MLEWLWANSKSNMGDLTQNSCINSCIHELSHQLYHDFYFPGTEDQSSSSSESESDDPDRKDDEFTKAFLMTGSKKDRGKSPVPRSATPTNSEDRKRKQTASPRSGSPSIKKVKAEPDFKPITTASSEGRPSTPVNSAAASNQSSSSSSRYVNYLHYHVCRLLCLSEAKHDNGESYKSLI